VLLACRRQAQAAGRVLEVRNMPERLQSLAHVYGVQGLLGH
jgi:ABC-type transporter Mla MlaB component